MEIAYVEPELAGKYARAMNRITAIFAGVLERSGLSPAEASARARRAFTLYQGHLQYYRMARDPEVFDQLFQDLLHIYKEFIKSD